MPTVSRNDRLVDLAAFLLMLAGALCCLVATSRLREIGRLSYQHPGPPTQSALSAADHARYLAYGGAALIVAGCMVGGVAAVRVARRAPSTLS